VAVIVGGDLPGVPNGPWHSVCPGGANKLTRPAAPVGTRLGDDGGASGARAIVFMPASMSPSVFGVASAAAWMVQLDGCWALGKIHAVE